MTVAVLRPLLHRIAATTSIFTASQNPTRLHLLSFQFHPLESRPLFSKSHPKTLTPLPYLRFAAASYDVDEPPERSAAPEEGRRLYVGNLPFSLTSDQLAELFSQAGTLDAVEIVYDRLTDRSRGFAFVTMGSFEDANNAIRMFDGSQVGGRTVKVNFPEVPRGGEREVVGPRTRRDSRGFTSSPHKVYVGNLGWSVNSQSLLEVFANMPGLLGARVVYNRDSGLSRGFGFVSFESPEEAQSAVDALNGREVEGRPLRLSLAVGKPASAPPQVSAADQSLEQFSEADLGY